MVERIAAVTLDMVTSVTNFSQSPVAMSTLISATMSPALQASRKACARGETLPSNRRNEAFHRAGLADHAGARD